MLLRHVISQPLAALRHPRGLSCSVIRLDRSVNQSLLDEAKSLTDLVYQRQLALSEKNIHQNMLQLFGATSAPDTAFAYGLRRSEDRFILNGLIPHLAKACAGEKQFICEVGAGSSYPASIFKTRHTGMPWLSRMLSSTIPLSIANLNITVADIRGNHSLIVLRDADGRMYFRMMDYLNETSNIKIQRTSLQKPIKLNALLEEIDQYQSADNFLNELKKHNFKIKDSFGYVRPSLDTELESELWNMNVVAGTSANYRLSISERASLKEAQRYDFIFGRHLSQRDYPLDMQSFVVADIVDTMRGRLTPTGQARLVFDRPGGLPGKCALIISQEEVVRKFLL